MKKQDIVEAARLRMTDAVNADRKNRDEGMDDLENLVGRGQWPEDVRKEREDSGRPVITINKLTGPVRQVTGDLRNMNPAIKIIPADGDATPEIAEVYEGLARHIEYRSDASSVYEGAAESAAQCGIGNFRILTEYEDDTSFNQEILIQRIHNAFSVYWDPQSRMPNREDANYCFITDQMKETDFKEEYPDAALVGAEHDGVTDGLENWHNEGSIVVAEYFWKEPTTRKIYMLEDGRVIGEDQFYKGMIFKQERTVQTHKVMWAKISGQEVLEGPKEYPCHHIPVVAITGEEMHVGEDVVRTSVIRFAKDPQRLYNYWSSAQTELVALQPKAPYLVTAKQIEGLEKFWAEANKSNRPYLPYNFDKEAGTPKRAQPPVASQGMMAEIGKASDDIQATTGIYDASLGQRSNETSGVAIRQRQMESDISTSIYSDNCAKAIAQCGRILVDMIPRIYDTDRMVRIVGKDDVEKLIQVNGMRVSQDGIEPINPLDVGKYDVRVSVGPNYSTKRQETAESMIEFIRAFPAAGPVIGDLVAKNLDWPGADELAERLKKMLPPGMISPDEMEPEQQQAMMMQQQQAQQAEQAQQQFAQMMQQLEARKMQAESAEAEADANKAGADAQAAGYDAMLKQLEVSAQTGEIQAVIQQAVAQALLAATQQGGYAPQ